MAYYDAFIAQKKLAVLRVQEQQLQLLIKISEGRLAYNKADLPNIYKARATLSDLKSTRINLQSMTDQAISILNALMNLPVDHPLQIDTTANFQQHQVAILQIDTAYVQRNRSDIKHTQDEIHSMELKQQVIEAMGKPTFGITWDNMRMNSGMYLYSAMASLSIPIAPWFSKGYKSKITAMDFQIQAMEKRKENQVSGALGNIRKDWLKLRSAKEDLQIFREEVIPAYAKTYQANLNAFSENNGDIYETLMAWNDLTMKKMEYYDKLAGLLNLRVMLETEMQQP
jgi:outer membrane protein TolC